MSNQKGSPPSSRRLSDAWLFTCFPLWVIAVAFLYIERSLRLGHVQWMVHVRQNVNAFWGSDDAFANIEHLLFGLATATLSIMIVTVAQDAPQLVPANPPPRWKSAIRSAAVAGYQSFRSAISSRLLRLCPWVSANTLTRTSVMILRLACVASPALLMLLKWKNWAYGRADITVVGVVTLLLAGAAWRPRRALTIVSTRPALMASAAALPVWLHFEGVWKLERVEHNLNTLTHALRHCVLSTGACCAALLAFHLFTSRPSTADPGALSQK